MCEYCGCHQNPYIAELMDQHDQLASLGDSGAEALRHALQDANPFVRDMAGQALFMRALAKGEAA